MLHLYNIIAFESKKGIVRLAVEKVHKKLKNFGEIQPNLEYSSAF